MGWADASMNGGRFATPGKDRLAQEGARFESVYVAAPLCSPSRASLLTGQYPPVTGVPWNYLHNDDEVEGTEGRLLPDQIAIGEVLREAGYRTAAIGKWGVGAPDDLSTWPVNWGFDYSYGPVDRPQTGVFFENDHLTEDRAQPWELAEKNSRLALDFIAQAPDAPFFVIHRPPRSPHPLQPGPRHRSRPPRCERSSAPRAARQAWGGR